MKAALRVLHRAATPRGVVCALALLWTLHLVANASLLAGATGVPRVADGAHQMVNAYDTSTNLKLNGVKGLWLEAREADPQWPPLVALVSGAMAHLVDPSLPAVRLYNMLFFAVLLVSVFSIGAQLHSRGAGLLAAASCSFAPALYMASRQFGLDFPAASMVAATFACLLYCDGFTRPVRAAACGLTLGLALLCRAQAALFLLAPFALVLARSLAAPDRRGPALRGAASCLAVAVPVSAIWWWGKLSAIYHHFTLHLAKETLLVEGMPVSDEEGSWGGEGDPSLSGGVKLYLGSVPLLLSVPLFLLALVLAVSWWRRRQAGRLELLLWLLVPLAAHILMVARHARYLLPLLPVLPVAAAMGAMSLSRTAHRRAAGAALLLLGAAAWLACSWPARGGGLNPAAHHEATTLQRLCASNLCGANLLGDPPKPTAHHRVTLALGRALDRRYGPETFFLLEEAPSPPETEAGLLLEEVMLGLRARLDRTFMLPPERARLPKWAQMARARCHRLRLTARPGPPDGARALAARWGAGQAIQLSVWEMPGRGACQGVGAPAGGDRRRP